MRIARWVLCIPAALMLAGQAMGAVPSTIRDNRRGAEIMVDRQLATTATSVGGLRAPALVSVRGAVPDIAPLASGAGIARATES